MHLDFWNNYLLNCFKAIKASSPFSPSYQTWSSLNNKLECTTFHITLCSPAIKSLIVSDQLIHGVLPQRAKWNYHKGKLLKQTAPRHKAAQMGNVLFSVVWTITGVREMKRAQLKVKSFKEPWAVKSTHRYTDLNILGTYWLRQHSDLGTHKSGKRPPTP